MVIRFRIPGRLRGKSRPRFVRATGRTYTDAKTASMEATVRQLAALAMRSLDPIQGPVKLSITMRINHPQSWSKKRKAETVFVTGKPDFDNLEKLVSDSMNGIVFRDDSQVALSDFDRRYSDGPEYVDVSVYDLSAAPFTKPAMEAA